MLGIFSSYLHLVVNTELIGLFIFTLQSNLLKIEAQRPALYVDSRGLKRQAFSRARGAGEAAPGMRLMNLPLR
jgi:hypothetical protein